MKHTKQYNDNQIRKEDRQVLERLLVTGEICFIKEDGFKLQYSFILIRPLN